MRRVFYILTTFIFVLSLISIPVVSSAATLNTVDVKTSKSKIAPGEEVNLIVEFGQDMGAYTVNAAYDNDVLEYVRSEGGTANDAGDKVILTYHYTAGSGSPRNNAVITFKAKDDLTASSTTNFSVTLTGMANPDASVTYDDITSAYNKDVLVEPNYVDYTLKLNYTGVIKKDEAKDMKLVTESAMGKNYDHVKLIAEVTKKPADTATAKLLATQDDGTEIDLIHSGWGADNGYALGGKNVKQELALRGVFNTDGKYTIHIKLIDRDNSDAVIVEKNFDITVGETKVEQKPNTDEKLPPVYPQTGTMQYVFVVASIIALVVMYVVVAKNKSAKH